MATFSLHERSKYILPRKEDDLIFLGEYKLKFTGKGRVILPKKLRDETLGKQIILSKGFEGCIWGFDLETWKKEADKQLEVSAIEEKGRFLRRYLFSSSQTIDLDDQGRFVIPSSLLIYASVREEVNIIGAGDHFEIWDIRLWEKHIKRIEREYATLT